MKMSLSVGLLLFTALSGLAQQPKAGRPTPAPGVPGGTVVLVADRNMMRAPPGTKSFRLSPDAREVEPVPIPKSFDWTKGHTIVQPMDGNDKHGDCYIADQAKKIRVWTNHIKGTTATITEAEIVDRYYKLTGGRDVGLYDEQIFGAFKTGLMPVNGPWKILDYMTINPTDKQAVDAALYLFGPCSYTFTVRASFMQDAKSGAVINRSTGGIQGGHAMTAVGRTADGHLNTETWGFKEGVYLTDNFVGVADSEVLAVFSLHWFNDKGIAPNGQHYQTLAKLWNASGGRVDPVGPFPPPVPTPPEPVPPQPQPTPPAETVTLVVNGATVILNFSKRSITPPFGWTVDGGTPPAPQTTEDHLKAKGLTPEQIEFILRLLELFLKNQSVTTVNNTVGLQQAQYQQGSMTTNCNQRQAFPRLNQARPIRRLLGR